MAQTLDIHPEIGYTIRELGIHRLTRTGKEKIMTPKIATHISQEVYNTTRQMIIAEAATMTEDQIDQRCKDLMTEADLLSEKMIHDKKTQDSKDLMYARWVAELSEMATIWALVPFRTV